MIDGRVILSVEGQSPEDWIGPPGLNRTWTRGRIVNRISLVQVDATVSHVVHFQHGVARQLPLDAKAPMLVVAHRHIRIASSEAWRRRGPANRPARKEVG